MKMHTAAHILSAIMHNETGALITGNQLGIDKSRIDFNLEKFDREKVNDYISKSNEIIDKDLKIISSFITREQAEKDPTLARLAKGLVEHVKTIRVLEIENLDKQADGGTHVKSTKEVGKIKFLKAQNKGKNNRRVYYGLE
jgi:misacylated tRNA(Ala) deacylase